MTDRLQGAPSAANEPIYPLRPAPLPGQTTEVAPGVHWLRMKLPLALNHINLWVLEDANGWTIVDTGIQSSETAEAWQHVLSSFMAALPVRRVVCTHMHPDHTGMAGWLTRRFNCALWMTRLEYLTCRVLAADTGREAPADALRFYHETGWQPEELDRYKTRFGGFGKMVYALPDSYRRVTDGEEILIGGRTWRAVIGSGHSPEHLCLHCPELRLLISGDQVLPRITSNVSVFPTEPLADPLTDWLGSLAAIRQRVPDDVLVLPSHNEPFHGLHSRIQQLIDGHEHALAALRKALTAPCVAVSLFPVLFRRPINADLLIMATGETIAHLNCLVRRGQVTRSLDAFGVAWWVATESTI